MSRQRVVKLLLVAVSAAVLLLHFSGYKRLFLASRRQRSIATRARASTVTAAAASSTVTLGERTRWLTQVVASTAATSSSSNGFIALRPVGCWRIRAAKTSAAAAPEVDDRIICTAAAPDGTVPVPVELRAPVVGVGGAVVGDKARAMGDYAYVACMATTKLDRSSTASVAPMTVERCLRACHDGGHAYAALAAADVCICLSQRCTAEMMLPDQNCQLPCAGDRRWLCGGNGTAAIYHLQSPDGTTEWTAWMRSPRGDSGSDTIQVAVRFRDCGALRGDSDDYRQSRRCKAKMQWRLLDGLSQLLALTWPQPTTPQSLLHHFIGCYAVATYPTSAAAAAALSNDTPVTVADCLRACAEHGFKYAFTRRLADGCSCSQTLGVSRPVTFCDGVYGFPFYVVQAPPEENGGDDCWRDSKQGRVASRDSAANGTVVVECDAPGDNSENCSSRFDGGYQRALQNRDDSTRKIENAIVSHEAMVENGCELSRAASGCGICHSTVELAFDWPPPDKRHVMLLAYHRSGSTYASEIFNKHPGALYSFEPDAIYSGTSFGIGEYNDTEQLHREFFRAFGRFLRCDVHRLPLRWMTLNSFFPRNFEHSPRMAAHINCLRVHGSVECASYFQAQCEAASIVSVKTIRITATLQTEAFVRSTPWLVVLHLMRDPRAISSSQNAVRVFSADNVRVLCDNMQNTAKFVSKWCSETAPSRSVGATVNRLIKDRGCQLFNMYYEDLVREPLRSARDVYTSVLRLNISNSTEWRLRVITGGAEDGGPHVHISESYTTRKKHPEISLLKWQSRLGAAKLAVVERQCAAVLRWYSSLKADNETSLR